MVSVEVHFLPTSGHTPRSLASKTMSGSLLPSSSPLRDLSGHPDISKRQANTKPIATTRGTTPHRTSSERDIWLLPAARFRVEPILSDPTQNDTPPLVCETHRDFRCPHSDIVKPNEGAPTWRERASTKSF